MSHMFLPKIFCCSLNSDMVGTALLELLDRFMVTHYSDTALVCVRGTAFQWYLFLKWLVGVLGVVIWSID